jgi:hypothetical protein
MRRMAGGSPVAKIRLKGRKKKLKVDIKTIKSIAKAQIKSKKKAFKRSG